MLANKETLTPRDKAHLAVARADMLLDVLYDLFEGGGMAPNGLDAPREFYERLFAPLRKARSFASDLLKAYAYFLDRCDAASVGIEEAYAGWDASRTPAFEAAVVQSFTVDGLFGDQARRLIDAQILLPMGIPSATPCTRCGDAMIPVTVAMASLQYQPICPACR
jgi:hypothetical protein